MKRSLAGIFLLASVLGACDKEAPNPVVAIDLVANPAMGPSGVVSIPVGGTVQLSATPKGGGGVVLEDREVSWESSNPAVATVTPATGRTTTVTGVATGTARITARSEGITQTIEVAVRAPISAACQDGATTLSLQVGQVFTASGPNANTVCLTGGEGAEYTYVPFFASDNGQARLAVEINASGVGPVTGPPSPALVPNSSLVAAEGAQLGPRLSRIRELELRKLEVRELTPLIPSARAAARRATRGAQFSLAQAAVPSPGDLLRLNARFGGCANPDFRTGRVAAVTQRAIVVVDTANPKNAGISDEEYRSFAIVFDTLIYPLNVENFGAPTDLDKNERVVLFYTRAVNELTPKDQPQERGYTAGFFAGRDLLPRAAIPAENYSGCAGSNEAEIFYLLAPDPAGEASIPQSAANVRNGTVGIISHEFQHLINATRRIHILNASTLEEVWLNEGLSHIAEELAFYRTSRLTPRQNIERTTALTEPVRTPFLNYQNQNFSRFISYLLEPDTASLMGIGDLPTRGAVWAFLRYAADRKAGSDRDLWFNLVNSTTSGLANLSRVLTPNPIDWMQDWTMSVYTDDAGIPVEPRFQQPSWNFRSIMPAYTRTGGRYPLKTTLLTAGNPVQLRLYGGGAAFVRFGMTASGRAAIQTTSGNGIPPQNLRISIVRTK